MKVDSRMPRAVALSAALSVALFAGAGAVEAQAATLAEAGTSAPTAATLCQPADYRGDGFTSLQDWNASMRAKRDSLAVRAQILINMYSDYATEDELAVLVGCVDGSSDLATIADVDAKSTELDEMRGNLESAKRDALAAAEVERIAAEEIAAFDNAAQGAASASTYAASYSNGSGLTRSSGVNNHNGRRETYYSSNALYHYRTSEWTQDSEGFWRDSEGYYVVAASDMAQGSVFEGSKGNCKVYDSGCAAGTTDYYTGW